MTDKNTETQAAPLHACLACRRHPDTHVRGGDEVCPMCGLGDAKDDAPPTEAPDDDLQEEITVAHELGQKYSSTTLAHAMAVRLAMEHTPDALIALLCAKLLERGRGELGAKLFALYAAETERDGLNPRPPSPGASDPDSAPTP